MGKKITSKIKNISPITIVIVVCILLAVSASFNVYLALRNEPTQSTSVSKDYQFLSKRIMVDNPNDTIINFVPLRLSLEKKFAEIEAPKSFYFEYLPSGTSIRIGSDQELIAASLIKLPLAMNLYKAAELGRINLDSTATLQDSDLDDAYGELWKKGAGYKITLREAAKLMLQQSDNTATHVIFNSVNGLLSEEEQSLNQMDVEQNLKNNQAVISSESYGSVLRSLYLSAYLNKDGSEELLGYLDGSAETRRLTAQLPRGVKVAHKNGVYNSSWSESDCGIVYAPSRPYIICLMIGLPEEEANEFIADVSKEVYDFVIKQSD